MFLLFFWEAHNDKAQSIIEYKKHNGQFTQKSEIFSFVFYPHDVHTQQDFILKLDHKSMIRNVKNIK